MSLYILTARIYNLQLMRLAGQQINHHIFLKFLDMICFIIIYMYQFVQKKSIYLSITFEHFPYVLYKALLQMEINRVYYR